MKSIYTLSKTQQLDLGSNAKLPWCVTQLLLLWAPLGADRIPIAGLPCVWECAEAPWEAAAGRWAGWEAAFLCRASRVEHHRAPSLALCVQKSFTLLYLCHGGVGDDTYRISPETAGLQALPCLSGASRLGWASLGLASLGLNCCFSVLSGRREKAW